jgi:hypothetical protein
MYYIDHGACIAKIEEAIACAYSTVLRSAASYCPTMHVSAAVLMFAHDNAFRINCRR